MRTKKGLIIDEFLVKEGVFSSKREYEEELDEALSALAKDPRGRKMLGVKKARKTSSKAIGKVTPISTRRRPKSGSGVVYKNTGSTTPKGTEGLRKSKSSYNKK